MKNWCKRSIPLLILVVLVLVNVTAIGEGSFDFSKFDSSIYKITEDKFDDSGTIRLDDLLALSYYSEEGKVYFMPMISLVDLGTSNMISTFSMLFMYNAQSLLYIDSIIVIIGDNKYNIECVPVDRDVSSDSVFETFAFIVGDSDKIDMMSDWTTYDSTIEIRLKGDNGNFDFVVPEQVKVGVGEFYTRYLEATGE